MNMNEKEYARFTSKYHVENDHYLWDSPLDRDGYGSFYFRRRNRRAHRVAWWNMFGDIPAGYVINHKCMVRHCVNPQHLEMITVKENNLKDSKSICAINARKTHCSRGHEFDRVYGKQRYCSICEAEKARRLRRKWREEDTVGC